MNAKTKLDVWNTDYIKDDNDQIMGEKEFFDVMKNANRLLTMEERFLIFMNFSFFFIKIVFFC